MLPATTLLLLGLGLGLCLLLRRPISRGGIGAVDIGQCRGYLVLVVVIPAAAALIGGGRGNFALLVVTAIAIAISHLYPAAQGVDVPHALAVGGTRCRRHRRRRHTPTTCGGSQRRHEGNPHVDIARVARAGGVFTAAAVITGRYCPLLSRIRRGSRSNSTAITAPEGAQGEEAHGVLGRRSLTRRRTWHLLLHLWHLCSNRCSRCGLRRLRLLRGRLEGNDGPAGQGEGHGPVGRLVRRHLHPDSVLLDGPLLLLRLLHGDGRRRRSEGRRGGRASILILQLLQLLGTDRSIRTHRRRPVRRGAAVISRRFFGLVGAKGPGGPELSHAGHFGDFGRLGGAGEGRLLLLDLIRGGRDSRRRCCCRSSSSSSSSSVDLQVRSRSASGNVIFAGRGRGHVLLGSREWIQLCPKLSEEFFLLAWRWIGCFPTFGRWNRLFATEY